LKAESYCRPSAFIFSQEVIANSIIFFVGGYETTSNLISYVVYEMAKHPHCQAKLQRELDDVLTTEQVEAQPL